MLDFFYDSRHVGLPIIFLEPSFPVLYHIIKRYVFRNIFVRFYRDIVSVSEESEFFWRALMTGKNAAVGSCGVGCGNGPGCWVGVVESR